MSIRPKPSTVIFAKDILRLATFYEATAGLSMIHSDSDHIVLDAESYQVVIHGIPKRIADSLTIDSPPQVRANMPIKPCLPVASIAAARISAAALGGEIGPASKEWQARGFRACDGFDPEGNVIQLREAAGV